MLEAAGRGDDAAWRELVRLYGRRVFALAKSRCGSVEMAEEVTQSVFVTVAEKLGGSGYTERGRFESWLFRVAMNRIRDEARRTRRRAGETPAGGFIAATSDGDLPDGEHERELGRLREALAQLSDVDREVVELRHHGGMSFKQMAEVLGEPLGTLLARHHRALRKLKALMEGTLRRTPAEVDG